MTSPLISEIQEAVAEHFRVRVVDLMTETRKAEIVLPRHLAMYLARELTTRSLPDIGNRFGGRDHTTVMHAIRRIEARLRMDRELVADRGKICQRIDAAVAGRVAA